MKVMFILVSHVVVTYMWHTHILALKFCKSVAIIRGTLSNVVLF